jgi:Na+/H+ antiporter NhaD/arsenite permease-like protein
MVSTLIIIVFCIGYLCIAAEHSVKLNKAATALVTGVICWTIYMLGGSNGIEQVNGELFGHLASISEILFFLLSAMTIVELVDAHDGFDIITSAIRTRNKVKLLWIVGFLSFFLSAILDNLTTTIVMVSLLRKLIDDRETRFYYIGMVVIAANAGGAWTPIGDVTTTMLWIGHQITALNIMKELFLPSLICMIVPLVLISFKMKGDLAAQSVDSETPKKSSIAERNMIFYLGLSSLVCVPIFKTYTHLPPVMGILLALGMLWIITEMIHRDKTEEKKDAYSVVRALQRIDVTSVLFFLGILLAIGALESVGILHQLALLMNEKVGNLSIIVMGTGVASAIVDNVPLVAAAMKMYDLQTYPPDSYIWEFLAYCAGTGGSILIIGSAAGVAAMGMEQISFGWYLRKIAVYALAGFFAGAMLYMMMEG